MKFFFFNMDNQILNLTMQVLFHSNFVRLKLLKNMLIGGKKVGNHHRLHHHIMFYHGLMRPVPQVAILSLARGDKFCNFQKEYLVWQTGDSAGDRIISCTDQHDRAVGCPEPPVLLERPPDSRSTRWLRQVRRWILCHEEASLEHGWGNAAHHALNTTLPQSQKAMASILMHPMLIWSTIQTWSKPGD